MKQIIGVDCDDVLVANFPTLVAWYNAQYGTNLTLADNNSLNLQVWGADSEEQAIKQVNKFFESSAFTEMKPVAGAVDSLTRLKKRYELMLFTARDHIIEAATLSWLEEHFADLFSAQHFTAQYSLEGKRRNKVDVLVEQGVSYIIDDALSTITAAAGCGLKAILFGDYPWNQTATLPDSVVRCSNWTAAEAYFNTQEGKSHES